MVEKIDIKKMKLGEFIAQTLTEIVTGISSAQDNILENGAVINPKHVWWSDSDNSYKTSMRNYKDGTIDEEPFVSEIDFDILLTVGEDEKAQGGLGIFATAFGVGVKGESGKTIESANRIHFKILTKFPQQQKAK